VFCVQTTHLVTTAQEVENKTQKVISALRKTNVFIVNDNFIHDSVQQGHKADERPYILAESDSSRTLPLLSSTTCT
jgi:nicotinamidase-related amidase